MGDITNYAIPFFIVTLIIEVALSIYGNREYYTKKDTFASLSMGIGSIGTSLITKGLKFRQERQKGNYSLPKEIHKSLNILQ